MCATGLLAAGATGPSPDARAAAPRTRPAEGEPPGLVHPLRDAEVNWETGLVTAPGAAAAELRLPTAEAARAGAERRARAAATAKLKAAVVDLPMGKGRKLSAAAIEAALAKAKTVRVEYQSNGGVLLRLGVSFADLVGAEDPAAHDHDHEEEGGAHAEPPQDLVLVAPPGPLEVVPTLLVADKERRPAYAIYRAGEPREAGAIEARRDRAGRITVPKGALPPKARIAGVRAVVHLRMK
jgi:hypothetical protein